MTASDFVDLSWDEADGVVTLTLKRPDKLNAVRRQTIRDLTNAVDAVRRSATARCLVITGDGRGFCAGQDLDEISQLLSDGVDEAAVRGALDTLQDLTRRLRALPVPTVAALNGVAVGFGAELAVACDLRVAARGARIGFVEVTRGMFETNGVLFLLPRIIGLGRATRLLLTGEMIDADEAHALGLVDAVSDDLASAVAALTGRLASNSPLATRRLKEILVSTFEATLDEVMEQETTAMLDCLRGEDVREGVAAFGEGRPAEFAAAVK